MFSDGYSTYVRNNTVAENENETYLAWNWIDLTSRGLSDCVTHDSQHVVVALMTSQSGQNGLRVKSPPLSGTAGPVRPVPDKYAFQTNRHEGHVYRPSWTCSTLAIMSTATSCWSRQYGGGQLKTTCSTRPPFQRQHFRRRPQCSVYSI